MRVTEGHTLLYEVVGDVRRSGKTSRRRIAHSARVERDMLEQFVKDGQAGKHRLFRVEQRLFILLEVLVIGEGKPLNRRQHSHETAVHAAGFAADEFGDIGIFLLRHDGGTRRILVGDVDEAELVRRIDDEILAEARKVRHQGGAAEEVFRHEIAVGNGIERVLRNFGEGEEARRHSAVDGEVGTRERAAAERHYVGALVAVGKALDVAQEHFAVRVEILRHGNWLRPAHMGIAGHNELNVVVCDVQERFNERLDVPADVDDAVLRIQAHIGSDLVVAGTGGMQFFAHHADALRELVFDERMYIFRPVDLQVSLLDVRKHIDEGIADFVGVFFRNDLRFSEHLHMRDACEDVVPIQLVIERKRLVEIIGALCARLRETSFPQFHNFISVTEFKPFLIDLFRRKP